MTHLTIQKSELLNLMSERFPLNPPFINQKPTLLNLNYELSTLKSDFLNLRSAFRLQPSLSSKIP